MATNSLLSLCDLTGTNDKAYFAQPGSAQIASKLLGVSIEELSKAIFSSTHTTNSKTNLRLVLIVFVNFTPIGPNVAWF